MPNYPTQPLPVPRYSDDHYTDVTLVTIPLGWWKGADDGYNAHGLRLANQR